MIKSIRIEENLWDSASRLRRDDWLTSIADLIEEDRLGDEGDYLLHISSTRQAVLISTFDEQGAPRNLYEVPTAYLRVHAEEYVSIIKKMHGDETNDSDDLRRPACGGFGDASAQMHTLDMAKKVVHDAGARTLAHELPDLARDHETYRRLFSLLLAIVIDVTAQPGAMAHRRHG